MEKHIKCLSYNTRQSLRITNVVEWKQKKKFLEKKRKKYVRIENVHIIYFGTYDDFDSGNSKAFY